MSPHQVSLFNLKAPLTNRPVVVLGGPDRDRFPKRYRIHQYWSRKPWYDVRDYIRRYTSEGDLVLDPFVGSGVTGMEAISLGRDFIGVDSNPSACLIARATVTQLERPARWKEALEDIARKLCRDFGGAYEIGCGTCSSSAEAINFIWKGDAPSHAYISCRRCGSNLRELTPDEARIQERRVTLMRPNDWFPSDVELPPNSDVRFVHELFTNRALCILSRLFQYIDGLPVGPERDLGLVVFTGLVSRTNRMIFVNNHRRSRGCNPAGVWGEKRFWMPQEFVENNVMYYLTERIKVVHQAKVDSNAWRNRTDRPAKADIRLGTATNLDFIPDGTVDYCYADPPYGSTVQYQDLSTMWNAWLSSDAYPDELVPSRGAKGLDAYQRGLSMALDEIRRVLRTGARCSIAFHSSLAGEWDAFIEALRGSGLSLDRVRVEFASKQSHNQQTLAGAVKSYLVFTMVKGEGGSENAIDLAGQSFDSVIAACIESMLAEENEVPMSHVYDQAITTWVTRCLQGTTDVAPPKSLSEMADLVKALGWQVGSMETLDYKGSPRRIPSVMST